MLLELPGEMLPSVNFINIYPSDGDVAGEISADFRVKKGMSVTGVGWG